MKTPWVLLILLFCYSINIISQEKSFNSTQIIKSNDMSKKTTEERKKILNGGRYIHKSNNSSFDECIEGAIRYVDDYSLSRYRIEIICANCKGHLGHIFDDGPTETGKRYCVNSVSIDFKKKS